MADNLSRYRKMRDFSSTEEPAGDVAADEDRRRFVIQEHHATRLHWDLRLEHDGALASWAVPNGIPEDPDENRKAVHTEDHPLEYLEFEGDIPKGNYGAGKMRIWDSGNYVCHKWEPRKVVFTLEGGRVQGRYALFQTGEGKDWMIHRVDPPADPGREPMPEHLVPMLAKLTELPADEKAWAFEIKWDGVRAIAYSEPGRLRFESRNLNDITPRYPELRPLGRALGSHSAVLDGEVVAFDAEGRPSFERLQHRMHLTGEAAVKRRSKDIPVVYVIFDLLYLDGHSLMDLPYEERRARLEALDLNEAAWRTPDYHPGEGTALLEASAAQGLEGIVGKRLGSKYEPGRRGSTWVKVKNTQRQELVVGGWLPGEGRRQNRIGALLVGFYERDDGKPCFRYAGKVGTGFTEKELDRLAKLLEPLQRKTTPFHGRQPPKGRVFVKPELVAEIEFTEWTDERMLRHPSYKGLRDDKHPLDVTLERSEEPTAGPLVLEEGEVTLDGRPVKLTNLDKVLWPKPGFTKGQMIDYYLRIAPVLLPHLKDRAISMHRYPDGVEGTRFWEKQCPDRRPDWMRTAPLWSDDKKANVDYCLIDDLPSLAWIANYGSIELHPSLFACQDVERPTALVFDLDPGDGVGLDECREVGLTLRGMFQQLGLESFAKSSGSKGLQVYVPLNTDVTFERTKAFSKAVAETLERADPELVVSRMAKKLRKGKVLVDWSQNTQHKTTVAAYSLRAKERPTVSTPVTWEEVEKGDELVLEAGDLLDRVEELGDLFAPVLTLKQELPRG